MIEADLKTLALADDDVEASIGDRFYPHQAPSGAEYPYVIFSRLSTTRPTPHDDSAGHAKATIRLAVWHTSYEDAKESAETLRVALDNYQNGATWDDHEVSGVLIVDERDTYAAPQAASEQPIFGVILDVEVSYTEPQEA